MKLVLWSSKQTKVLRKLKINSNQLAELLLKRTLDISRALLSSSCCSSFLPKQVRCTITYMIYLNSKIVLYKYTGVHTYCTYVKANLTLYFYDDWEARKNFRQIFEVQTAEKSFCCG